MGFQRGPTAPAVCREVRGCLSTGSEIRWPGPAGERSLSQLCVLSCSHYRKLRWQGARGSGYIRGTQEEWSVTASDAEPGELCMAGSALWSSRRRARELLYMLSSTNAPRKATSTPTGWSQQRCRIFQGWEYSRKLHGRCQLFQPAGPGPTTAARSVCTYYFWHNNTWKQGEDTPHMWEAAHKKVTLVCRNYNIFLGLEIIIPEQQKIFARFIKDKWLNAQNMWRAATDQ